MDDHRVYHGSYPLYTIRMTPCKPYPYTQGKPSLRVLKNSALETRKSRQSCRRLYARRLRGIGPQPPKELLQVLHPYPLGHAVRPAPGHNLLQQGQQQGQRLLRQPPLAVLAQHTPHGFSIPVGMRRWSAVTAISRSLLSVSVKTTWRRNPPRGPQRWGLETKRVDWPDLPGQLCPRLHAPASCKPRARKV